MSDALARLAATFAQSQGVESLTRPLLELLQGVTGLESTYLTTVDEAAGRQQVRYASNAGALTIPEGIDMPWSDTLCRRAIEQGVPYTDDVPGRWGDSAAARDLGITTYVTAPVRAADGQLLGTLCAASQDRRPLTADTHHVMALFSHLIARQMAQEAQLQQLQDTNRQLAARIGTDALTGLPNRSALHEALRRRLGEAAASGRRVHLGFVDLDGFKAINDTHGHEVGDRFLRAVGARLNAVLRQGDIAARYGGDEFVVLFDAAPADGDVDARLRDRLEAATRGHYELGDVALDYPGASVGIAASEAEETDMEALIARADAAMYARKRERRATR